MKTIPILTALCVCFSCFVFVSQGAPLPELGKVDIKGTVARTQWTPAKKIAGIPGLSGSAGRDRTIPAHHLAVLKPYAGPDAEQARRMNAYLGAKIPSGKDRGRPPARLLVRIESEDPGLLKTGMKITLTGYTLSGDEGGVWSRFETIRRVP